MLVQNTSGKFGEERKNFTTFQLLKCQGSVTAAWGGNVHEQCEYLCCCHWLTLAKLVGHQSFKSLSVTYRGHRGTPCSCTHSESTVFTACYNYLRWCKAETLKRPNSKGLYLWRSLLVYLPAARGADLLLLCRRGRTLARAGRKCDSGHRRRWTDSLRSCWWWWWGGGEKHWVCWFTRVHDEKFMSYYIRRQCRETAESNGAESLCGVRVRFKSVACRT